MLFSFKPKSAKLVHWMVELQRKTQSCTESKWPTSYKKGVAKVLKHLKNSGLSIDLF